MRVLLFDDRHDRVYGSQRTIVEHGRQLAADDGVEVLVGSSGEGRFLDSAEQAGLTSVVVPVDRRVLVYGKVLLRGRVWVRLNGLVGLARSALQFRHFCKRNRIDVVVAASLRPLLIASVAAVTGGVRVIWYVQNAEYFPWPSRAGRLIADHIAVVDVTSDVAWRGRDVTEPERRVTASSVVPVPEPRIDRNAYRKSRKHPDAPIDLVSVGAIIHRKGFDRSIKLASEIAVRSGMPTVLTIVGERPHKDAADHESELRSLAAGSAARVVFAGWHQDPLPFVSKADALLFLSRSDAWGRVVDEALAVETLVVGCEDLGAVRALIHDGKNGCTIPQSDDVAGAAARATDLILRRRRDGLPAVPEPPEPCHSPQTHPELRQVLRSVAEPRPRRAALSTRLRRFRP